MLKLYVYVTEINNETVKLSTYYYSDLFTDICELTYWKYSSAAVLSTVLLVPLLIHHTAEEFSTRHSAVVQSAVGKRVKEKRKRFIKN